MRSSIGQRCRRRPRCRPPPARGGWRGRGAARRPRAARRRRAPLAGGGAAGARRTRCPGPAPSLCASTAAAVQLDQALAPATGRCPARPGGARRRCGDLGEQVEHLAQHLGRDADAVVAHAHHAAPRRSRLGRHVDAAAAPACTWPRCSAGWRAPAPAASGRPPASVGSSAAGRSTARGCARLDERPAGLDRARRPRRPGRRAPSAARSCRC